MKYLCMLLLYYTLQCHHAQAQEVKRIAVKDALSLDSISTFIPFGKWVMLTKYKKQYGVALKCGQPICFMSIKPNKQKNTLVLSIDLNVYPNYEYPQKQKTISRDDGRTYFNQFRVIDADFHADSITFWCELSNSLASCKRFYWIDKSRGILFDYISQKCYTPESNMKRFPKINWSCYPTTSRN